MMHDKDNINNHRIYFIIIDLFKDTNFDTNQWYPKHYV